MNDLLKPRQLDCIFQWPFGKARRLALEGKLPYVTLPDGALRFDRADIEQIVENRKQPGPIPKNTTQRAKD